MVYHELDTIQRQIIAAAAELVGTVGADFTMEQLVERANIPRATIYRRIGNKEALLRHLAEQHGHEVETADIRSRMLEAARQVFGRYGLQNTTMEQIASEAGVGVATVYRHFGDKDGLIRAFIEASAFNSVVSELTRTPSADVASDLRELATILLRLIDENRAMLRLVLFSNESDRTYLQRMRSSTERTLARLTDYFAFQIAAGRLQAAGSAQDLGLTFMGMVMGHAIIGPLHYDIPLDDPARVSRLLVALFLHGLAS